MATMRNAISEMGGDAKKVNPACPVHMIIDHSIDVRKIC
jgi:aconitate hydratase